MDGVSFKERVDLGLTDQHYKLRRESGRSGADNDRLSTDNMAAMAMLSSQVLKTWSQGHVLCSNIQLSK